jgi:hypothetical protein
MPPQTPTQITKQTFLAALARYPSTVPPNLVDLDHRRYTEIPAIVAARRDEAPFTKSGDRLTGYAFLTKDEAVELMEWKLYVLFEFT